MPTASCSTIGSRYRVFHTLWNRSAPEFAAAAAGADLLTGDFDGNGVTDIAAVPPSEGDLTLLLSDGVQLHTVNDGYTWLAFHSWNFVTETWALTWFGDAAQRPGAMPIAGDFDGNGRSDIAILGADRNTTMTVASSFLSFECLFQSPCNRGIFVFEGRSIGDFATWADQRIRPRL